MMVVMQIRPVWMEMHARFMRVSVGMGLGLHGVVMLVPVVKIIVAVLVTQFPVTMFMLMTLKEHEAERTDQQKGCQFLKEAQPLP